MTNDNDMLTARLQSRDIRPTAIRLMVLRAMMAHDTAFSLLDLENDLDTVDKSTIYRTITQFLVHHIIHAIDDGSGSLKYAVCGDDCDGCTSADENGHDHIDDLHAHFYCEQCHRTFCLRSIDVPITSIPGGFKVHSVNYVLKGLCPSCSGKANLA